MAARWKKAPKRKGRERRWSQRTSSGANREVLLEYIGRANSLRAGHVLVPKGSPSTIQQREGKTIFRPNEKLFLIDPETGEEIPEMEEIDPVDPWIRVQEKRKALLHRGHTTAEYNHVVLVPGKSLKITLWFQGSNYYLQKENFVARVTERSRMYHDREELMFNFERGLIHWNYVPEEEKEKPPPS